MKSLLFKASSILVMLILYIPVFFIAASVFANEIYVNQIGDGLTFGVTQDGDDNYLSFCATTTTTDAVCGTGWNKGNQSDNSTVAVGMYGDDNNIHISHAAGVDNSNTRESNIVIIGDDNYVQNRLVNAASTGIWGGHKETNIAITGNDNTVKHNSDSYGEVEGNISVTGNDNDINLYQRAMDSVANISVTNAGGAVTVDVDQLGSSYQDTTGYSTSVTSYCTAPSGCTITVTQ